MTLTEVFEILARLRRNWPSTPGPDLRWFRLCKEAELLCRYVVRGRLTFDDAADHLSSYTARLYTNTKRSCPRLIQTHLYFLDCFTDRTIKLREDRDGDVLVLHHNSPLW